MLRLRAAIQWQESHQSWREEHCIGSGGVNILSSSDLPFIGTSFTSQARAAGPSVVVLLRGQRRLREGRALRALRPMDCGGREP